jgi:predicted nucleic acid-binding protein
VVLAEELTVPLVTADRQLLREFAEAFYSLSAARQ